MRSLVGCSFFAIAALGAGCAVGVPPGSSSDDDIVPIDARTGTDGRTIDARLTDASMPIDAPAQMQTVTLNQVGSTAPVAGTSIACSENDGAGGILATRDNSYYRVFRLADFGVNRAFTPTMVSFGVEQSTTLTGSQSLQVRLYTLNGALSLANLTSLTNTATTVGDLGVTNINVPIPGSPSVPATSTVVVEVFSPDGDPTQIGFGNVFFIGANNGSETATGYLRSAACGLNDPMSYASLGFPTTRLILSLTGTY